MEAGAVASQKAHRPSRTKKESKSKSSGTGGKNNAVARPGALARRIRLAADRSEKRAPNPALPVDRTGGDAAPRIVTVVGPRGVGKSTIIRNLVRHYSKRNIPTITGPITTVAGHRKRITFVEVGPDLSSMIDAAKVADLVLLVIDASYGFEMETFEFLNIAATHGMPKVMAILTHLDKLRDGKQVRNAKKSFKDRIWAELYNGAKLFYLSGITTTGDYLKREVLNLARFISVTKYPNITWRSDHPYVLADRIEDISPKSLPENANRTIAAYGYVRGTPLRAATGHWRVHLAGVGDLSAQNLEPLPDPCPAANLKSNQTSSASGDGKLRRRIAQKERMVHAPMAPEIDGIAFDRDAVYINLAQEDVRFSDKKVLVTEAGTVLGEDDQGDESSDGEGEKMVKRLQKTDTMAVDESLKKATLQLVKGGKAIVSENVDHERFRRPLEFGAGGDLENPGSVGINERLHEDESEVEHDGGNESESESESESENENDSKRESETVSESESESASEAEGYGPVKRQVDRARERKRTMKIGINAKSESDVNESDDDKSDGSESRENVANQEPDVATVDSATAMKENSLPAQDSDDSSAAESISSRSIDDNVNADEDEQDVDAAARRWKDLTLKNAEQKLRNTISPSKALEKYIYGDGPQTSEVENEKDSLHDDESDAEDDFFRPRKVKKDDMLGPMFSSAVMEDMIRLLPQAAKDWISDESACARLRRKRFATGQRSTENEETTSAVQDEAVDGDFEDLETGEKHTGSESNPETHGEGENEQLDIVREKKIRKKERFNKEWDAKDMHEGDSGDEAAGSVDEGHPNVQSRKALRDAAMRAPDPRKLEREKFEKLRNEEFGELDAETRLALEGIPPGQYVRMELQDVPTEFVRYFDPNYPVLLGGLKASDDEGKTYLRARIRRHRFKRGVLKSTDPVVMSIGWRRFQTIPIYDIEDQGRRRRYLKYSPEYLHCNATFWAPSIAPGAGVVIFQTLGRDRTSFRIAGTGVVTELDTVCKVVKKLKLVGEPVKVYKNTAFIKGMFNSELEVSKYIGAGIRTVSGIRGIIKKGIPPNSQGNMIDNELAKSPPGTFRAGFEDKILFSDIVFLRAWVPVEAPKFCSIATTLLDKDRSGYGTWRMKTIREVRESKQMAIPVSQDSLYKPIDRARPVFTPLRISKKLESSLPYASKPKNFAPQSKPKNLPLRKAAVVEERALVLGKKERKERKLLQAVYSIRNDRMTRKKEAKTQALERRKKEIERAESKHLKSTKERKKRKFALQGAREAREAKRRRGADDR